MEMCTYKNMCGITKYSKDNKYWVSYYQKEIQIWKRKELK